MYPNKRLGQYSLINKGKIKEIVDALDTEDNDTIIEIGAGQGELTKELEFRIQNLEFRIIAIEKDKNLTKELQKQFENHKNIEIIEGDILKILPALPTTYNLKTKTYKIVGNIPYYITGQLLRVIGELTSKPSIIILTLQKEVAERLCAKPPKMNLLAASVQFWANPEIIDYIPKEDFKPQPKVDSAIIRLRIKNYAVPAGRQEPRVMEKYYKLIKVLFKQPRKTILNNLSVIQKKEEVINKLKKLGIDPNGRPQDLSIEIIEKLNLML